MTTIDPERRKGGGKLSRSETVTVRLDPKLRYLAELAARKQRRTLSSYVEWAIEDSLRRIHLDDGQSSLADTAGQLWDVDDADRFAKLGLRHPELLTHEEQIRWKLIRECPGLWRGHWAGSPERWQWSVDESSLVFGNLRKFWQQICDVADGTETISSLPEWLINDEKTPTSLNTTADDDIPF